MPTQSAGPAASWRAEGRPGFQNGRRVAGRPGHLCVALFGGGVGSHQWPHEFHGDKALCCSQPSLGRTTCCGAGTTRPSSSGLFVSGVGCGRGRNGGFRTLKWKEWGSWSRGRQQSTAATWVRRTRLERLMTKAVAGRAQERAAPRKSTSMRVLERGKERCEREERDHRAPEEEHSQPFHHPP